MELNQIQRTAEAVKRALTDARILGAGYLVVSSSGEFQWLPPDCVSIDREKWFRAKNSGT